MTSRATRCTRFSACTAASCTASRSTYSATAVRPRSSWREVFLRAWRHAARYDPEREAVRAWLYQIAHNAIIDARRRAAARPGLPRHGPAAEAESGETLEQAMLGWQVAAALKRLTPEHRQMIRMVQFCGLTMREIAAHTALPLGTVKSRTWDALRSLRLELEEMG